MTQQQLDNLDESELQMLFYIVNVVSPTTAPKIEYDMHTIKWMRHEILVKKIMDALNMTQKDAHPIYLSMLEKLGVVIQIKYEAPPTSSVASSENTGSSSQTPISQEDLLKNTSPITQSLCPPTETVSNTISGSGTSPENTPPVPVADSNTADTSVSSA